MDNCIISTKNLDSIFENVNCSCHLKDVQTGKYVISNRANFTVFGYNSPDQMVGYSIWDLNSVLEPYWGNSFAREVNNLQHN